MAKPKPLASVDRALTVVEFLAQRDGSGVALTEMARELSINKATLYNTLATLRERAWVEQDSSTGFYRLGDGILPLTHYRTSTQLIVETLHPALIRISRRFNELVHLGRLTDTKIQYLDKVEPDRSIRVVSQIGRNAVAARTGLGRALIGSLPESIRDINWYMEDPEILNTSASDQEALKESLQLNIATLHKRGWTTEVEENEPGIACVAVPVQLSAGRAVAISVTAPIERMEERRHADLARGIAEEISSLPNSVGASVPQTLA